MPTHLPQGARLPLPPCFPVVWQLLPLTLQNSDVRHAKDWAEPGLLFISVAHTRSVGEGNGNPLQYSYLENPMDRGAWWAAIYGAAQSWTGLKRLSSSSIYMKQNENTAL